MRIGKLSIEMNPMNPPKPTNIVVTVEDKIVAYIELEHFRAIARRLAELEDQRR